jgi:hypothetical protein
MLIAKLTVSINDAGIAYNSATELEAKHQAGDVLEDGKVVRGLGTHFASKEAKERYDKLTAEGNAIRVKFANRFLRTPIEATFIISKPGEAREFAAQFASNPDIVVRVFEFELGSVGGNLDEMEMKEWSRRVKEQLKRVPLGRSEEADEEGLDALETLASCPVLARETAERLMKMVNEARVGTLKRADLKRNVALLDVSMDQTSLEIPRSVPA